MQSQDLGMEAGYFGESMPSRNATASDAEGFESERSRSRAKIKHFHVWTCKIYMMRNRIEYGLSHAVGCRAHSVMVHRTDFCSFQTTARDIHA